MNTQLATFTANQKVYQIVQDASRDKLRDQLNAKISHMQAMLDMLVSASGMEHFRCMNDSSQENYLWSISMAADEAKDLIERL